MVINVTAAIVLKTAMRFCNGNGRNLAIVLHTVMGFTAVLDATLSLYFGLLLSSEIVMNIILTLSMLLSILVFCRHASGGCNVALGWWRESAMMMCALLRGMALL